MIWEQRQFYPIDCLSDSICFNRKEVHYFSYWNYFSCLRGFVHFFSDSEFLLNLHWTNHVWVHFFLRSILWWESSVPTGESYLSPSLFSQTLHLWPRKQIKYPRTHLGSKEKSYLCFYKKQSCKPVKCHKLRHKAFSLLFPRGKE